MRRAALALTLAALVLACSTPTAVDDDARTLSEAELRAIFEQARVCEPGDRCVWAGSRECACGGSVNERFAAVVEDAARRTPCPPGGPVVLCVRPGPLVCEDGLCGARLSR